MPCSGNKDAHCCWLAGKECPHLEENTVPGRRWACGLRRRLGDWDSVLASEEYRRDVAPIFEPLNIDCKSYPREDQHCDLCAED